jgi:GTP-binding protein
LNTLIDYRYRQHFFARNGQPGSGRQRTGKSAEDVVLQVPVGTEILEEDGETLVADLTKPGQRVLLAEGGNGGWGNLRFKSSTNQAPRNANPGQEGVERTLWLRLKLLADAGLVGLPNAGKSTFINQVSNAAAKVGEYAFTTLVPKLGVVRHREREFVLADIPGLIQGAHEGRGLGDAFLAHVERCAVILQLVDGTAEDVAEDFRVIDRELDAYGAGLAQKPRVLGLNKVDALTAEAAEAAAAELAAASGMAVHRLSGATGQGVPEVLRALRAAIASVRAPGTAPASEPWRP